MSMILTGGYKLIPVHSTTQWIFIPQSEKDSFQKNEMIKAEKPDGTTSEFRVLKSLTTQEYGFHYIVVEIS